jgi:hypothetical protein
MKHSIKRYTLANDTDDNERIFFTFVGYEE